jgi:hypothetical protein
MKAGTSKSKVKNKITKKLDAIRDWDNKKVCVGLLKKIFKASFDENEFFKYSNKSNH